MALRFSYFCFWNDEKGNLGLMECYTKLCLVESAYVSRAESENSSLIFLFKSKEKTNLTFLFLSNLRLYVYVFLEEAIAGVIWSHHDPKVQAKNPVAFKTWCFVKRQRNRQEGDQRLRSSGPQGGSHGGGISQNW